MKLRQRLVEGVQSSSFRKRLLTVGIMICFLAFEVYRTRILSPIELVVLATLLIAQLFGYRTKSFWFLFGIALGVVVSLFVSHANILMSPR